MTSVFWIPSYEIIIIKVSTVMMLFKIIIWETRTIEITRFFSRRYHGMG
jgi:hypothetical protein